MKNRLASFILMLTIVSVTTVAMTCGCAIAAISQNPQVSEESILRHCEPQGGESEKTGSEDCCIGCKVDLAVLKTKTLNLPANFSNGTLFTKAFAADLFTFHEQLTHFDASKIHDSSSYHTLDHDLKPPLYILLESFLI